MSELMELFAAVDLLDGRAVRLVRGEFGRADRFGEPRELAERFLAARVPWLHVVDLDAARSGLPVNRAAVLELAVLAHRAGARIEVGGGVRTTGDVDDMIAAGVDRVVLGTAAIETPGFARACADRHPGHVAIGIDYRRTEGGALMPAVRGWLQLGSEDVPSVLAALEDAPLAAAVVTAIDRDGTREGSDIDTLAALLDATTLPVVASGGVGSTAHLRALAELRSFGSGRQLSGVVVGRALVDGTIGAEEAVSACAASG